MALFEVPTSSIPKSLLRDDFIVPPFSILDAKSQYWMDRKHEWERILEDRSDNIRNVTSKGNTPYCNAFDNGKYPGLERNGKISTFDPFLTEILVKWFSKPKWTIYDPFAGGIVRGAVSGICGRNYYGTDISPEQVKHNTEHWNNFLDKHKDKGLGKVHWELCDAEKFKFKTKFRMMMTCPPYYDLEKYTDDPDDLSNQSDYKTFIGKYRNIIRGSYNLLEDDSFAVITVAEIRDKNGSMYGFVPDTIKAFTDAGFIYYNEMILENRVVSLGVRSPKYFNQSRKVGRHHQNVLVFFKGNPDNIEAKFGKFIEVL